MSVIDYEKLARAVGNLLPNVPNIPKMVNNLGAGAKSSPLKGIMPTSPIQTVPDGLKGTAPIRLNTGLGIFNKFKATPMTQPLTNQVK